MIKKVKKALYGDKEEIVLPIYEKYTIEKGEAERGHRNFLTFHPSAFGDCLRKMAFQYHGETKPKYREMKPISPQFTRICDAGHAFHHRMQSTLSQMGILRGWWRCRSCGNILGKEEPQIGIFLPETCECLKSDDKRRGLNLFEYEEINLRSDPEYNITGHCDGIVELEKGNPDSRYIIDFKTIKTENYAFLKEADSKYKTQVTIYMWLSGVKKSIIYYENKNDHDVSEFPVVYEEGRGKEIMDTAKKLFLLVKDGKIPKQNSSYTKTKDPCRYCYYKDKFCFQNCSTI